MNLSDFSLDALIDPFLDRINREYVAKQNWLARQILEPAVDALIAVKLDPLAEELAKDAVKALRAIVERWLKSGAKKPLAVFASESMMQGESVALYRVGINPFIIFSALQLAFTLIEKLLPYFKATVSATEDGSVERYVIALDDDSALDVALGLAA